MASKTQTPGERLRDHRNGAGFDLDDLPYLVKVELGPDLSRGRETIRRYEADLVPEESWNPFVVAALAKLYKVEIRALSVPAAEALEPVRTLLASIRCLAGTAA